MTSTGRSLVTCRPALTRFTRPTDRTGTALTGSQSSGYTVTFEEASPTIRVSGIPLIAFQGDTLDLLVNVTAMGTPVNESRLTVNMSGQALGQGMTDDSGSFSLRGRVNGSAGLQSITINSTGNGLLAAADISAGALLVSPFDLATSLAIVVIVLAVAGLAVARATNARRRLEKMFRARRKPLPEPAISVAPGPATLSGPIAPPAPARFEDEFARISAIVAGRADHQESSWRFTRRRGAWRNPAASPSPNRPRTGSSTGVIVAREPRLHTPAGTITRHYRDGRVRQQAAE